MEYWRVNRVLKLCVCYLMHINVDWVGKNTIRRAAKQ